MDKSWMDAPRHTADYLQGLAIFLGYPFSKSSVENKILCPCKKCVNSYWREESIVREHLVCEGFVEGYKQWLFHGEHGSSSAIPPNLDEGDDRDEGDNISDLLRDLAAGLDKMGDLEDDCRSDQDNSFLESLHKLEADARQELYPGCKKFSKLRFLVRLLHTKLLGGWSDKSFNLLLDLLKDAYPESAIPKNYNEAKKLVKCLGLGAIAKKNRANAVPHTSGSKSHARVTEEMAVKLGQQPRRDQVYIETHTCKKGEKKGSYVPQAATTIKDLIDKAEEHPEWKEKSIEEGDLFARVCGMKEPRGRVRVLGLGPTPQDLGTPGTRGKTSTRVLVETERRRHAENRINTLEGQMQQMQDRMNQMQELILASQGGHNLETPSSQHGSNSRQNSRVEAEDDNEGEEDDDEEHFVHRRVVAKPPSRSSSTHEDIGMEVLLLAWTGPETPVAKATVISTDRDTVVGGEPLGPATYEVIVNVAIKRDATLPYQYDDLRFVADAVTRSIAWPSSKMKPYKPGTSSLSRR